MAEDIRFLLSILQTYFFRQEHFIFIIYRDIGYLFARGWKIHSRAGTWIGGRSMVFFPLHPKVYIFQLKWIPNKDKPAIDKSRSAQLAPHLRMIHKDFLSA
jgi:hypothetical protein